MPFLMYNVVIMQVGLASLRLLENVTERIRVIFVMST